MNIGLHASTPISFAADLCATRNCWRQTGEHFLVLFYAFPPKCGFKFSTFLAGRNAIFRMYDSKLHYVALCCMMLQVEEQFRMLDVTMLLENMGIWNPGGIVQCHNTWRQQRTASNNV